MKFFVVFVCFLFWNIAFSQQVIKLNENISLEAYISKFDISKHEIDTIKNGYLIDKSPWFGGEGMIELPVYQLDSLVFVQSSLRIYLDVSHMYNPIIDSKHFELLTYRDCYILSAWFPDGQAKYCVKWKIVYDSQIRIHFDNDCEG